MAKAGAHRKRRSPRPQPAKPPEPEPKLPSPTSCVAQPCACLKAEDAELILCRPQANVAVIRRRVRSRRAVAVGRSDTTRQPRPQPQRGAAHGRHRGGGGAEGATRLGVAGREGVGSGGDVCGAAGGRRGRVVAALTVLTAQTDRATDGFVLAVRAICVRLMESRAVSPVWAGGNDRSLLIRLSSNTWLPSSERPGGIDQSSAGRRAASLCCATAPTLAARLVAAPPPAA